MATSGKEPGTAPVAGSPDQKKIYEGLVWKLSPDGKPSDSSSWLEKNLWVTDGGGLFYHDRRGEPRGSHCRNLKASAVVLEGPADRFAFEITPNRSPSKSSASSFRMVLAASTAEDRAIWLRHIASFEGAMGDRNSLSPYDIFGGSPFGRMGRRRSSATLDLVGVGADLNSAPIVTGLNTPLGGVALAAADLDAIEPQGGTTPRSARLSNVGRTATLRSSGSGLSTPRSTDRGSEKEGLVEATPTGNSRRNFAASEEGHDGNARDSRAGSDEARRGEEAAFFGSEDSDFAPSPRSPGSGGVSKEPFGAGVQASVRRNSQCAFAEKAHTTLVLDWDDTIFPTTWIRQDCGMNWKLPLNTQLEPGPRKTLIKGLLAKLLAKAREFFQEAATHANIFIVTLARRPWVEMSMQNFLPELGRIIEVLNLKVIYAQEYVEQAESEYEREEFLSSEEVCAFWTRVKSRAIAQELDEFHKQNNLSWKNVISVGDSDFERYGTINAGEDYMRREMEGGALRIEGATAEGVSKDGHLKRLRTKTVKLLGEPTVEELTAELTLLKRWLPHVVRRDAGFDVEIDTTDDDVRLNELDNMITGDKDGALSWQELAGMAS
jgi:hypothetical protein